MSLSSCTVSSATEKPVMVSTLALPSAVSNRNRSAPAPPLSVSLPVPPLSMSAPPLPERLSLRDGRAGHDYVDYGNVTNGVRIDLRISGPQDTGEGVDTLRNIEGV
jgi:hypothetical protein